MEENLNGHPSYQVYLRVLGPLLFLIYINDLTDKISLNIRLFADDSSLFLKITDVNLAHRILTEDLEKITAWAKQ